MSIQGSNPATAQAGLSTDGTLTTQAWVKIGLVFAAFAWLFCLWLQHQAEHSAAAMEDWGHAFIVPLISGFMVWQNRRELLKVPPTAFWPGLAPMLLGIVCYFFFIVGISNHMFMGLSMILTLAGVVLFLLGPRIFGLVFLPIAFLVFAVTVSEQVIIKLTFTLQQIAAGGAWLILRLISALTTDFVVTIEGNTLTVAGKGLNVAEACSGMRMVVAFVALAGAVGLLSSKLWWQRTALMMLAVPVAVFNNVLRVAVLGLISMWKPELATGDAHMLIGTILLVLGLGIFMGILWALNKIVAEESPASAAAARKVTSARSANG
jgi:exosortase